MSTYRFRLKFYVHVAGVIRHAERTLDFQLPNGSLAKLSCTDEKTISKGKEFVLSAGEYDSEQEAYNSGCYLKNALLISGVVLRIGVDAGKDIPRSQLGDYVKDKIFEEHRVRIINDVHGLSVYSEEYPVKIFSSHGALIVSQSTAQDFVNIIAKYVDDERALSDKEQLSLELYGASHFEKSDRARFITLVLALEALLIPEERSSEAKQLVNSLIELTNRSYLQPSEKESIIGSLRHLYHNSISQSLKAMARAYLDEKKYSGDSAVKFISKCYDARCKLVHTGRVDETRINIGSMAAQLDVYIADLLRSKLKIT